LEIASSTRIRAVLTVSLRECTKTIACCPRLTASSTCHHQFLQSKLFY
jgi:hypothetical protein